MTEDLELHQMDMMTAFLTEDLEEEIYLKQSKGFKQEKKDEDLVYLLKKNLYELKQAMRL